ncbi:Maf family nucleotide pyrophosphatase [Halodesulfovibrio marinisediminis]|uniref:dTTP/UTP pyrophosphatase n=1 Tax=Halodesulfovibrio marinisediminis DSM 17456 TaxID=1121457 RepID=A0A1N6J3P9_9BACT|nr:Maf family nucleotide pyrophosphatase [Halodesulfovibrio marinisediminis]SIO38892.1 septum formation protein [Halodesulfovibrio marinisediminis DSM 17456]
MSTPVYTTLKPVVLASGSPRRSQFLSELGIIFTVETHAGNEPLPEANEVPAEFACRCALTKTLSVREVSTQRDTACFIGADTIVVLGDEIMGKPTDDAHALDMLSRLSGNTHKVITATALVYPDGTTDTYAVETAVTMKQYSADALKAYIRTGEPADKAGAYAIQGIGSFLVELICGSWSNVVGLPVTELLEKLQAAGVVSPSAQ